MELQVPNPGRSWWLRFTLAAAFLVIGATALAMLWLLHEAHAAPPADRAALRIDAIRTSLAVGAGLVGIAAFVLALRRQWHQEAVATDTSHDATERRVTELYTAAVEQLGSNKAPIRLGGLYALERLAQNNPEHRQTIVNVICAYLRMPYTPPPDTTRATTATTAGAGQQQATPENPIPDSPGDPDHDVLEELEVHLTAQHILAEHLRPTTPTGEPEPKYWGDLRIDLTRATLIDLDFRECQLGDATFDRATFTGNALFTEITFTGNASFGLATFTGNALFTETAFTGDASFDEATFTGNAWFGEATFTGNASFEGATFTSIARFGEATFTGNARFGEATFTGNAWFEGATFTGNAWFEGATFTGNASFDEATFTSNASFDEATFTSIARFEEATFTFNASFDEATFDRQPSFTRARARQFGEAQQFWPEGWVPGPAFGGDPGYRLLERVDDGPSEDRQSTPAEETPGADDSGEDKP